MCSCSLPGDSLVAPLPDTESSVPSSCRSVIGIPYVDDSLNNVSAGPVPERSTGVGRSALSLQTVTTIDLSVIRRANGQLPPDNLHYPQDVPEALRFRRLKQELGMVG